MRKVNRLVINRRDWLDQVYWLGGSPCAGKSSVARLLSKQYNLILYSIDARSGNHRRRFTPDKHSTLIKWTSTPWDELWMQPHDVLLAEAIACYTESFDLALPEVFEYARRGPTIVEGNPLLPQTISAACGPPSHSLWMTPTASFQQRQYRQRGEWVDEILSACQDPEAAYQHWMKRDIAFAQWIRSETVRLGLPHMLIDGTHTIGEHASQIADLWQLAHED